MKYLNDVNYKDCVGKVCKSLNSGDFKNCISTFLALLYFNTLKSPDDFDLNTLPTQSL